MFQSARRAAGLPRGYRDVELAEMRLRLLDGLSAVLEESADVAKHESLARKQSVRLPGRNRQCAGSPRHDHQLQLRLLVDNALRENRKSKWSAKCGYCFFWPGKVRQHGVWSAASPPTVDEELPRRAGDVLCGPERPVTERSGDIGDVVPETSVTGGPPGPRGVLKSTAPPSPCHGVLIVVGRCSSEGRGRIWQGSGRSRTTPPRPCPRYPVTAARGERRRDE
jgi:hypothetical protein